MESAHAGVRRDRRGGGAAGVLLRAVPVAGWLFILLGLIAPLGGGLRAAWLITLFLSAVVHPLQLVIALPLARRAGYSTARTVLLTVVYGAAWWRSLLPAGVPPRGYADRSVS